MCGTSLVYVLKCDQVILFCLHVCLHIPVTLRLLHFSQKCERVNLKASQLLRSSRGRLKNEQENCRGFIISVQCFLSQFHHPVWRGILFPLLITGCQRGHTQTPHTHTHICAHSYRCWQRSEHLHILSTSLITLFCFGCLFFYCCFLSLVFDFLESFLCFYFSIRTDEYTFCQMKF